MLFATLLAASIAAVASLSPAGPWNLRAGESRCTLTRDFGEGADRVTLVLQPVFTAKEMDIIVFKKDDLNKSSSGKATAQISPIGEKVEGNYVSDAAKGSEQRATRLSMPASLFSVLAEGQELSIESKPVSARFKLTGTAKARTAFLDCEKHLLEVWQIDPAWANPGRKPIVKWEPGKLVDAYPPEAMRAGLQGRTIALLTIDAKGTVATCRIIVSAGAILDDASCRSARKIGFSPAQEDGRPVPSIFVMPAAWVMP